jgi:FHA domain
VWSGRVPMALPIEVGERPISIGRDGDVAIDDPRLSRHHAQVARANGRWTIRDLESHNGTFVGGLALRKPMEFADDELRVVRVGDTLLVAVRDVATGAVALERGIVVGRAMRAIARTIAEHARVHIVGERGSGKRTAVRHAVGGDIEVIALDALPLEQQRDLARRDRRITSSRIDPRALAATGALVPELADTLGAIIEAPPLRDRPHELPHFALAALATRSPELTAHAGLIEQVLARTWPGNARELFAEVGEAAGIALANKQVVVTAEHLAATAGVTLSGMITPVQPVEAPNPDE